MRRGIIGVDSESLLEMPERLVLSAAPPGRTAAQQMIVGREVTCRPRARLNHGGIAKAHAEVLGDGFDHLVLDGEDVL